MAKVASSVPSIHELYEASVQEPEAEGDFFDQVYAEHNGGKLPRTLREDFCGTAAICRHWVERREDNSAVGLDLDPNPLAFAERRMARLSDSARGRVRLVEADVLAPPAGLGKFDVVCAFNFSYWCFAERATLVKYLTTARKAVGPGGVFVADFFGGSDCHKEMTERRAKVLPTRKDDGGKVIGKGGRFTYVWEQGSLNPATGEMVCHISFELPGPLLGKPATAKPLILKRAFSYQWRLYTMPELVDIFKDAGFATVKTYLEKEDRKGNGTGHYVHSSKASADLCFLAYIVAMG